MTKPNRRVERELNDLQINPPEGIACYRNDDINSNHLTATIIGPEGSPYEGGVFRLSVTLPDTYPFQPPAIRFTTPVYHPNIDNSGRICLSLLKMGENGDWSPAHFLKNVLLTIRLLLVNANPEDPLEADIAKEFRENYAEFEKNARAHTKKYAKRL